MNENWLGKVGLRSDVVCVCACERYVCMDVCVCKCVKNVCGLDIECYTSETVRDFRGCPMILCTVYSTCNVRAWTYVCVCVIVYVSVWVCCLFSVQSLLFLYSYADVILMCCDHTNFPCFYWNKDFLTWLDLISLSSLSIIIPPTHPQKNIVSIWLENMQPLIQVHWKLCVCFGLSVVFFNCRGGGGGKRACRELVEGGSGACVGCLWGCGGDVCKLLIIFIILPSLVV